MEMSEDRIFFDPCPLAIGKGLAYLLAFLTAVIFSDVEDKMYFFGIILYCCGSLCDYIEVAAYRTDKCDSIRRISAFIAILVGVVIIFTLSLLYGYDTNQTIVSCVESYYIWINLFLAIFWAIPLGCGIMLIFTAIGKDSKKGANKVTQKGLSLGYKIKP